MITALSIIPHTDHFALLATNISQDLFSRSTIAYIYPCDGAWVMTTLPGRPTLIAMDTLSLERRLYNRYKVYPSLCKEFTDYK
jgi:hypothetical protein